MAPVETLLRQLPPDLRREAEDFIVFLTHRREGFDGNDKRQLSWKAFIDQTYGCMASAPIQRPPQAEPEVRLQVT